MFVPPLPPCPRVDLEMFLFPKFSLSYFFFFFFVFVVFMMIHNSLEAKLYIFIRV